MGIHGNQFVNVSVTEDDAESVADEVRGWMIRRGFIDPEPRRGCYVPLPAIGLLNPDPTELVTFEHGPMEAYAMLDAYEGPTCRLCGATFDPDEGDDTFTWLERWYEGDEIPELTCKPCGWTASAVDWNLEWGGAAGHAAVVTDCLQEPHRFLADLNTLGNGRWVYVYMHP